MTTVYGDPRYAGQRFAAAPYAGDDKVPEFPELNPGVALVAPVAPVTTGVYEMSWVFEAPLDPGTAQVEYRIQVEVEGIVVIDSGWLLSAVQTHIVDLAGAGLADDVDAIFRVAAHQSGRGFSGVDESTVDVLLGLPTVAYLEPDPVYDSYSQSQVLCRWTYADTQGNPQVESRVRLWLGTQLVFNSDWVPNATQEYAVPFLLFDGSRYTIGLTVRNSEGVESVGAI